MCCKQLMFNQTHHMNKSTLMCSTTPKCQSYSGTTCPTKDLLNVVPDEALKLILCEPETSASNHAWGQRSGAKVEGLTFNIRCTESEMSSLNCLMLLLPLFEIITVHPSQQTSPSVNGCHPLQSDGFTQNEDAHDEDHDEEEPHEEAIHNFGNLPPLADTQLCSSLVLV